MAVDHHTFTCLDGKGILVLERARTLGSNLPASEASSILARLQEHHDAA
jgi:hypothetical protein